MVVADRNTTIQELANLENIVLGEIGMVVANCIAALRARRKIARYFKALTSGPYLGPFGSFFALGMILSPISSRERVFCSISHFAVHVVMPDFPAHLDSR